MIDADGGSARYRWFVLGMLFLCYTINLIDRQLISLLVEPIAAELNFTDAQMGLLVGLAFAVGYSAMSLPVAWLADRWRRVDIISYAVLSWSLMTSFTGMASGYWSMLVARAGVGVGEAGLSPPAYSLMADYFKPDQRGRAMGVYNSALPFAGLTAGLATGVLEKYVGWRLTFVWVGAFGLLLALVFRLTVRESRKGATDQPFKKAEVSLRKKGPAIRTTIRFFMTLPSFWYFAMGSSLFGLVALGMQVWAPAFFMRTHGMDLLTMATTFGVIGGVGGLLGALTSGILVDFLSRRDLRWYMWIPMTSALVTAPFAIGVFTVQETWVAAVLCVVPAVTLAMALSPVLVAVQMLMPADMRAMGAAVFMLVIGLIGTGLGPVVVGILSDSLRSAYGEDSLRYSIVAIVPLLFVAAALFWQASRYIVEDSKRKSAYSLAQAGMSPLRDVP